MAVVTMKQLLECGVHFGHQTRRWNPKMKPYIFTERNGVYIIDLQKTVRGLEKATSYLREMAQEGGDILFVGTKRQAQETIREEALRCRGHYINQRWLGGLLTNFQTIRRRVNRMLELQRMDKEGELEELPKKEAVKLRKQLAKLEKYLLGIKDMRDLPEALFVVDPRREVNAVLEARKLGIPVIAIVDTNCDPEVVDFPIPGNDDAIRAIRLMVSTMANAMLEGRQGNDGGLTEEEFAGSDKNGEGAGIEVREKLHETYGDTGEKLTVRGLEERKGWKEEQ